jgi:hypothetical protein
MFLNMLKHEHTERITGDRLQIVIILRNNGVTSKIHRQGAIAPYWWPWGWFIKNHLEYPTLRNITTREITKIVFG